MKTALVERWERRLKEYEDMREQMRLSAATDSSHLTKTLNVSGNSLLNQPAKRDSKIIFDSFFIKS